MTQEQLAARIADLWQSSEPFSPAGQALASARDALKHNQPWPYGGAGVVRGIVERLEAAAPECPGLAALMPDLGLWAEGEDAKAAKPGVVCGNCWGGGCAICSPTPSGAGRPQEHLPQQAGPLLPG